MGYRASNTEVETRDLSTTPDGIVDWVVRKYGCDVDLAARLENKKCHRYYSDAMALGFWGTTGEDLQGYQGDGLIEPWYSPNQRGWLNPPYSNVTPWLQRAIKETDNAFTTVALLSTFNGEKWGELCFAAREIIFIIGRIQFWDYRTQKPILNTKGKPGGNNRGSMLCIFGPHHQSAPAISYIKLEDMK